MKLTTSLLTIYIGGIYTRCAGLVTVVSLHAAKQGNAGDGEEVIAVWTEATTDW